MGNPHPSSPSATNIYLTTMGDNNPPSEKPLLTDPPFYLPEFEESHQYILNEYAVEPKDIGIFIPCAMRKPYSASPSHQLIKMVISQVFSDDQYHIVVFGTCGIVPSELEEMYPYAHYKYMLGKCKDQKVLDDFLRIETDRVAGYLEKTRHLYRYRIAYCLGIFREAFIRGAEQAGVEIDLILPTTDVINLIVEQGDCAFQEGSLSMDEYLGEFCEELIRFRNRIYR
ncbi:archaeosine synthase [Methanocalculus alkaliphilus]|nr:archaeosine synthase [Methanocalculus alkaliphilus]